MLALISATEDRPTWPRGAVSLCHHRHGSLRAGALVVLPQVQGVPRVPRRANKAPGPTVSVPRRLSAVGDPLSVPGRGGARPDSAREPSLGSSSRAPPGTQGAREGQGLEWRDAVAEVLRSEVTRNLVAILRGSTPRPAEHRGRARRSFHRCRQDESSLSSSTAVSRSGDESAVVAQLGAYRATPTPSTVPDGSRGIDLRTEPAPGSERGGRRDGGSRATPREVDSGFPTQRSLATRAEAEGWPTKARPPPPARVVPPKIVVNRPYYRKMLDCETYALGKKSAVSTRRQARALGRRKKDFAQSFRVHGEWDGSPPAKVFQFLRKFAKACDDDDIPEGEAFYLLHDFTKEPLQSGVMLALPIRRERNPGEVTNYLELIHWMLRRHVDEASVETLVEALNIATQRDDEDELLTTRPANPTQSGGRRSGPCRRAVLSGNTRPRRRPRRAHTHGVDRGKTPRATNTSCVTGSLLARVEGLEVTLTPRPLIPSVPIRPSENPPQTPSKDPQKTFLSGPMGPVSAEDGRSFGHHLE